MLSKEIFKTQTNSFMAHIDITDRDGKQHLLHADLILHAYPVTDNHSNDGTGILVNLKGSFEGKLLLFTSEKYVLFKQRLMRISNPSFD